MQKGFTQITLLIFGLLIFLTIGWVLFNTNFQNIRKISSYEDCIKAGYPNFLSYPGQCNTPDGQSFVQGIPKEEQEKLNRESQGFSQTKDINDFPIYPNATYQGKDEQPACEDQMSGFSLCNSTTFNFKVSDNFDQVVGWYRKDVSNSGWKCTGGAGSYTSAIEANGTTSCKKGNLKVGLDLDTRGGSTQIQIIVLRKSPN